MLFTSGVVGLLSNLEISRYLEIVHFQSRILEIEKTRDFRNTNPKEWEKIVEQSNNQRTITSLFEKPDKDDKVEKYPANSKRRQFLNRKVAAFLAIDMKTLNIVNGPGFRQLLHEFDPRYTLPTPKTLRKKLIPNLYAKCMGEIIKDLDDVKHCSLTTDGWTSVAGDKFTAYTIHYINWSAQEPVLKTKILECSPFEAETADAAAIEKACQDREEN